MTDREKLIEMLVNLDTYGCEECQKCVSFKYDLPCDDKCFCEKTADHLLSNGVTIQRWIPVTERLPERTMPPHDVLVYHDLKCGMFVDRAWYSYDLNRWCSVLGMKLKVTHWMPLPERPKEVE